MFIAARLCKCRSARLAITDRTQIGEKDKTITAADSLQPNYKASVDDSPEADAGVDS